MRIIAFILLVIGAFLSYGATFLLDRFYKKEYAEKEIATLKLIGNLKYREIASLLNKPMGTVQWIYNNAIKKLRKKVGEKNE